jgi:hypothetical protein
MPHVKLENNWRNKALEKLENDYWGNPPDGSYLIKRTHEIRTLPLSVLTNDDIAMMIRQKFSLDYMLPLAIDKLQIDILAHGETGTEGAIMDAVLRMPASFWKQNSDYWMVIKTMLDDNSRRWTFKRAEFDRSNPVQDGDSNQPKRGES